MENNQTKDEHQTTIEISELDWLKVQEELDKFLPPPEPFPSKAARLTKENPFVPLGEYT